MILPGSTVKYLWDVFILLLTIYTAIEVPAELVFSYDFPPLIFHLDHSISAFFLLDVIVNFNTALIVKGKVVRNRKTVAGRYLKTWFLIDFLSAVPISFLFHTPFSELNRLFRLLRLLRLLKLVRLANFLHKLGTTASINPVIMRMMFFVFWIIMFAHWVACGWVALGGITDEMAPTHLMKYLLALYWSFTTLTTVGYGDISPSFDSPTQTIYAIVIMILGAGMYGYIIGNIATLLANIDVAKANFTEKMERLNAFMKYREVPIELKSKILDYYDYVWESRLGYDESDVLDNLPISLRREVSLHINRDIIEKVPLFRGASSEFFRDIVLSLRLVVFLPGDYIIKKGELGEEMFFINRGVVEVVSDNGRDVYATLTEGNFFGEMALLLSMPRTANIRAADYCDLYTIDKKTFERVLERYPDFYKKIQNEAEQRKKSLESEQSVQQ